MAIDPISLTVIALSTAYAAYSSSQQTKHATKAAKAESTARQNLYDREEQNQKNALTENSRTRLRDRERKLAELRVHQAASGFSSSGGTQLAIFGDFKSKLDDRIDEATNQGLDRIAQVRGKAKMDAFSTRNQIDSIRYKGKMDLIGIGIDGATKMAGAVGKKKDPTSLAPTKLGAPITTQRFASARPTASQLSAFKY